MDLPAFGVLLVAICVFVGFWFEFGVLVLYIVFSLNYWKGWFVIVR